MKTRFLEPGDLTLLGEGFEDKYLGSSPEWQFNWLKFSLEKPLEFWLEFWLEFPLDSTEEKGPF